jgi:hypothetical protein
MLRTPTDVYNLNQMSHDAAIILIRKIVDMGDVKVKKAYIDTVGNPQFYQRKLEREFPNIEFVVESKADANYAPCSAASVGKTLEWRGVFVHYTNTTNALIFLHVPCTDSLSHSLTHSACTHKHKYTLYARSGKSYAGQDARKLEIFGII